jgi:Ca2+-binding RTX toxin-like protein
MYVNGTPDNDTYAGTGGNDGITGVGGDDVLSGEGGNDTIFGGDGHDWIDGGSGDDIIGGGMGNDTFVVDSANDSVLEGTNQGTDLVRASVSFSLAGRQIEYLTLTGVAHINATGNGFNNLLVGNSGNNVLDGGAGADILQGGLGDDTYYVDHVGDNVVEAHWGGTDTVNSRVSYSLFGRAVEILNLTGAAHIDAAGNGLANILTGNSGNNRLDGGTGADTLSGGAGNDTYHVDVAGDRVEEGANGGTDEIVASVSYQLLSGSSIETLILTGSGDINATGNTLDNRLIGNAGNNVLEGGPGHDWLDGGAGADTMNGSFDNDTYVVDDAGDVINNSYGIDIVFASISFTLGANATHLTLTGSENLNGTGNGASNMLVGNDGVNVLTGGNGDDSYYVQNTEDVVIDKNGEGRSDYVYSTVSYSLDGTNVENIVLQGTADINATGNHLSNSLRGNSGINVLSGGGGNDYYYIQNEGDTIVETGSGHDRVYSSVSFDATASVSSVGAFASIEAVFLTGGKALNAFGDDGFQTLSGNSGANILNGRGGRDDLVGYGGADTFVFEPGSGNDEIVDFSRAQNDRIDLQAYTHGVANDLIVGQVGSYVIIDLEGDNQIQIRDAIVSDVLAQIIW